MTTPAAPPAPPATVPQAVVPRLVEDVALARVLGDLENKIWDWRHNKGVAA